MTKSSPTQHTLAALRAAGYTCEIVEQNRSYPDPQRPGKRKCWKSDLYGLIDVLAINATKTVGIQCTTDDNALARVKKALAEPKLAVWLKAPGRVFEIWGFRKRPVRGKDMMRTWCFGLDEKGNVTANEEE